jgi:hypothetical protein
VPSDKEEVDLRNWYGLDLVALGLGNTGINVPMERGMYHHMPLKSLLALLTPEVINKLVAARDAL